MRCSQRCSQRALVLKTRAPQVADLRRHVELEGIEPSTSSMPWIRVLRARRFEGTKTDLFLVGGNPVPSAIRDKYFGVRGSGENRPDPITHL